MEIGISAINNVMFYKKKNQVIKTGSDNPGQTQKLRYTLH